MFHNPRLLKVFLHGTAALQWLQRDLLCFPLNCYDCDDACRLLGLSQVSIRYVIFRGLFSVWLEDDRILGACLWSPDLALPSILFSVLHHIITTLTTIFLFLAFIDPIAVPGVRSRGRGGPRQPQPRVPQPAARHLQRGGQHPGLLRLWHSGRQPVQALQHTPQRGQRVSESQ